MTEYMYLVSFLDQNKWSYQTDTVEALVSDHLGNSEKWLQLELVVYENELS